MDTLMPMNAREAKAPFRINDSIEILRLNNDIKSNIPQIIHNSDLNRRIEAAESQIK
jgi:hypothetical protein